MKSPVSVIAIVVSVIAIASVVAFIIVSPWESDGPNAPWDFDGTEFKDGQVINYVKDYLRDTKRLAYEAPDCHIQTAAGWRGTPFCYIPLSEQSCWDWGFSRGNYRVTDKGNDAKYTVVVSEFRPDKSEKSMTASFTFDGMTGKITRYWSEPVERDPAAGCGTGWMLGYK
jgi:hypothetical protein